MDQKLRGFLEIDEAINNLETVIDSLFPNGPLGIAKNSKIVTDKDFIGQVEWLEDENLQLLVKAIDLSLSSIEYYLKKFEQEKEFEITQKFQSKVKSIYSLVLESLSRLDVILKSNVLELNQLRSLKSLAHLLNLLEEVNQKIFSESKGSDEYILRDSLEIQSDRDYELFLIKREDGSNYYDEIGLQNLHILCRPDLNADVLDEDPLLKIRHILDQDALKTTNYILEQCAREIQEFYKVFKKMQDNDLANKLSSICLTLLLAHNPKNQLHSTKGKTALEYLKDFHRFLREAFLTIEYQKLLAYPPTKGDLHGEALLSLIHKISYNYFFHNPGLRKEVVELINDSLMKGSMPKTEVENIWTSLLVEDEAFRSFMLKFPSGPVLKTVDQIRVKEGEHTCFDPIHSGIYPSKLMQIEINDHLSTLLFLPCPTIQETINKADPADEFRGMLRYLSQTKGKHILFSLQNPNSWKEHSRVRSLLGMELNAEFNLALKVIHLPRTSDFYHQTGLWLEIKEIESFLKALEVRISSKEIVSVIHSEFFDNAPILDRRQREEFIEIADYITVLSNISELKPSSFSFTCKDGLDNSSVFSAGFFAFLKIIDGEFSLEEDHKFFKYLAYGPAMLHRERPVDGERVRRTLFSLETVQRVVSDKGSLLRKKLIEISSKASFQIKL
jgi:hypothetical protein